MNVREVCTVMHVREVCTEGHVREVCTEGHVREVCTDMHVRGVGTRSWPQDWIQPVSILWNHLNCKVKNHKISWLKKILNIKCSKAKNIMRILTNKLWNLFHKMRQIEITYVWKRKQIAFILIPNTWGGSSCHNLINFIITKEK